MYFATGILSELIITMNNQIKNKHVIYRLGRRSVLKNIFLGLRSVPRPLADSETSGKYFFSTDLAAGKQHI
jgi:hypothetical protein